MLKKSIIVLCAVLILALLIGCSADSIVGLGRKLGKLSDATLVPRNPYYVEKATENVEAFIEESEKALSWKPSFDAEKYDGSVEFKGETSEAKSESKQLYLNAIDETVNVLLSARDSSANDKALRAALDAKYEGLTFGKSQARKNLFNGLVREEHVGYPLAAIKQHLETPESRQNLVMILAFWGVKVNKDQLESVSQGVKKLEDTNLPMPLQSCDYCLICGMLFEQLKSVITIVKNISKPVPGDKPKLDMSVFVNFQEDIKASVKDRDYQTVGDKIAVGIIFSVMNEMVDVAKDFEEHCPDPENPDYDLFFDFVMADPGAKASLDKVLSYFDALSYVYNAKLDIAGLVSGTF